MAKPHGTIFRRRHSINNPSLSFESLVGVVDGHCLKLVLNLTEKGRKRSADFAVPCEKVKQKAQASYAVTDTQASPALHETTEQLRVTSTASFQRRV